MIALLRRGPIHLLKFLLLYLPIYTRPVHSRPNHRRSVLRSGGTFSLTADTYGKWLPLGNKAAVDRLDAPVVPASGSKLVAGDALEEEENSEVVGEFGGPCRGRTYGPLIKSGRRTMIRTAQCYEGFPVYHGKSWGCSRPKDSIGSILFSRV